MRSQPPSRVATGTTDRPLTKEQLEAVDDLRDLTKLHAPSGGWVVAPQGIRNVDGANASVAGKSSAVSNRAAMIVGSTPVGTRASIRGRRSDIRRPVFLASHPELAYAGARRE